MSRRDHRLSDGGTFWINYPPSRDKFYVSFETPPAWKLTTQRVWGGAVPLLFVSFLLASPQRVRVPGIPLCSPFHGPLLQPPHATLGSADEIRPEELQGLLMWRL